MTQRMRPEQLRPSAPRWADLAVVMVVMVGLSGCTGHDDGAPDPSLPPTSILYSPNGEPLNGGTLGKPTCQEAMGRWFDRVDSNHDGVVSRDEFLSDARTQFKRMDIDGTGILVPEELDRFRLPFRQPPPPHKKANATESADRGPRSDTQPDPVMSADIRMTSEVGLDDFLKQAATKFTRLDTNHRGSLDRAQSLALCEAKR